MKTPLRIGVNALFLIPGGVGGTEIYTRSLLETLARNDPGNEYFIYRNRETGAELVPREGAFFDRPQPVAATSRPARIAYEQLILPIAFARDRIDVVLNCGITAPLLTPLPMVTVFYDLQYKQYGGHLPFAERLATQFLFPAAARRSERLVTMTRSAERELQTHFPFSRGKTLIVPHGVDPKLRAIAARRPQRMRSTRPFVLAVSSLMAHKNFDKLLLGFSRFRQSRPDVRLVVAGVRGRDTRRLESIREGLGLGDAVTFTGWIPRSDLLELFATAEAFVFASKYEGFGIPVLEALTAGIPLACSDIPVLREIAGEAACFFDPDEPESIARVLAELFDDPALCERLRAAGLERAQRFNWDQNVGVLIHAFGMLGRPRIPATAFSQ
jgi:glycosyltransferase involved in cell wall biosynthesis